MAFRIVLRSNTVFLGLLAALFVIQTATAQTAKLTISATPAGLAAKGKPIPVSAAVGVTVTIKNEGSEPLSNVVITARLNGAKLASDSNWKIDGDDAKFEIASLAANEEIMRPLNLAIEMAPLPPGRQIEIAFEAKSGNAAASSSVKFPVADCAAAFQADLTRLRIGQISEIWPTADDMRKPDTSLPRTRYFRVGFRKNNEFAALDRLAAGYQARLLSHYDFFSEGVRYTARRWSDELKSFAGQEPNPGICAVNNEMYDGIRKTIQYVTLRLEPPMKAYARGIEVLRKHFNAEEKDDLKKIALKTAEAAGAKFTEEPATAFEVLARAKDLLKDVKLTEEQLDNLSLIESAAWVEAQSLRSKKLNDLIEGSITGIAEAQKKNCVCAF